jgi:hypothetical protein
MTVSGCELGRLEKPFEVPMHHMDVVPRNIAKLTQSRISD